MSAVVKKIRKYQSKLTRVKHKSNNEPFLKAVYLDGKLKEAPLINEQDKSFGIFMHSLILSNSIDDSKFLLDLSKYKEYELKRAVKNYSSEMGFDSRLIESIAPKLPGMDINHENKFYSSTHLINGKLRIVLRGAPEELMKRCSHILLESKLVKYTRKILREANDSLKSMINMGLDVYAIALKDISSLPENFSDNYLENNMALVALVGVNPRSRYGKIIK